MSALPTLAEEKPPSPARKRVVHPAVLTVLGLSAVVLILTLAEFKEALGVKGASWSVRRLFTAVDSARGGDGRRSGVGRKVASSRRGGDDISVDRDFFDYASGGDPPKGFEQWLKFAKENQCHLGPYERIERDLKAFAGGGNASSGPRITRAQLEATKKLDRVVVLTVKNGVLTYSPDNKEYFAGQFKRLIGRFVEHLPDLEFVANELDEPRVLPGVEDSVEARMAAGCKQASDDFRRFRHMHGSVNGRANEAVYIPGKELLPLFSQSKINECFSDITYPTLYGFDNLLKPEDDKNLLHWSQRNDTLFFRGATSGGHYTNGTDFLLGHRQRLVDLARGKPHMDIAFSSYVQCEPSVCAAMEHHFGPGNSVPQQRNFEYKYLMSIDGNTFVSRLPLFMSAGSLPFRSGLYSEWFDEWLHPDVHYLRVKFDFSDLEAQLRWARSHDDESRLIGQRAREYALRRLRNQDMECYMYRLLLEYAVILE